MALHLASLTGKWPINSGGSRGEARPPPIFFDQNEVRRAGKKMLRPPPPPPPPRILELDDRPPFSEGLSPPLN